MQTVLLNCKLQKKKSLLVTYSPVFTKFSRLLRNQMLTITVKMIIVLVFSYSNKTYYYCLYSYRCETPSFALTEKDMFRMFEKRKPRRISVLN